MALALALIVSIALAPAGVVSAAAASSDVQPSGCCDSQMPVPCSGPGPCAAVCAPSQANPLDFPMGSIFPPIAADTRVPLRIASRVPVRGRAVERPQDAGPPRYLRFARLLL